VNALFPLSGWGVLSIYGYIGLFVLIGLAAISRFADTSRLAKGYIFLTLVSVGMFAATAISILLLSHRQSRHSLIKYLPHYGIVGGAMLLTLGCCWWRFNDLVIPFQLSSYGLSSSL
jgi:hypothetical protein